MEPEFWHQRWVSDEIAFHNAAVHTALSTYWHTLELPSSSVVLVPLSGKTIDMWWLAEQGHVVIGIELSERATQDFFAEKGVKPIITEHGDIKCYQHERITLICADFFAITPEQLTALGLKHPDAVYDRAALIALPADMRKRYVQHLSNLLPDNVPGILVTLNYPHPDRSSPPFPISDEEAHSAYGTFTRVTKVTAIDLMNKEPRFTNSRYAWGFENIYRLGSNPGSDLGDDLDDSNASGVDTTPA